MLGKIGDIRAVEPLIRALDAPGFQTPIHAAEALGKLGDERAIEPLVMLAASSRDKMRETIMQALSRLGHNFNEAEPLSSTPEPEIS